MNPVDLRHLRRFIKPDRLPSRLKSLRKTLASQTPNTNQKEKAGSGGSLIDKRTDMKDIEPILFFLICATSIITFEELRQVLLSSPPFLGSQSDPHLDVITVPLFPPTSESQAKQFSQDYWPTAYKGDNPFGPHPTIVMRATDQIKGQVEQYMNLATRVGLRAVAEGIGLNIGAVVVNRKKDDGTTILAVAGDARWQGISEQAKHGGGNVMAHSVMRVIGIVAQKRRSLLIGQESYSQIADAAEFFADEPLTSLEKEFYAKSGVTADGYLCSDLELYVTHEPCVMCCMAVNHSRFGRVVFGESMLTGGLQAERGRDDSSTANSTYGIWWRKELNWKFLTWTWASDGGPLTAVDLHGIHA